MIARDLSAAKHLCYVAGSRGLLLGRRWRRECFPSVRDSPGQQSHLLGSETETLVVLLLLAA